MAMAISAKAKALLFAATVGKSGSAADAPAKDRAWRGAYDRFRKSLPFMPVLGSSGESRLKLFW